MALLIAALASPHHRHEFWTACLESKGCVRYCGSSCFNKAKRSQKHRNLLPHAAKPLADEHWRKPLEARRAIEAKVEASSWGTLEGPAENRIVRLARPGHFVDPKGPNVYCEYTEWPLWEQVFTILAERGVSLPGSRYACAQAGAYVQAGDRLGRRPHGQARAQAGACSLHDCQPCGATLRMC